MYERFQVEQKPGFASGTERYLLRWKFSMTTGGIEIDIGQRQHGAKRALCLCELSRAFVTISSSTHLLFISLHPFSFLFFFKRRTSSQACRGQLQGSLTHYLSRIFVVFVYCFVLGAAYFDSLTLQSKLDEAALLTGAAGAAR